MTKEDILNMQPEIELNYLVAENIMKLKIGSVIWETDDNEKIKQSIYNYSTDISYAWDVFKEVSTWLFSKRRRFFQEIQSFTRTNSEAIIAWPDVLIVLKDRMPEAICKAALIVKLDL
jgi:hypothetical protein